jgi:predicted MFS family arabinose efflux permease
MTDVDHKPAHTGVVGTGDRANLAVGFVTLLLVGTDLFVVSPLLPAMAQHYDVTPGAAGLTVTLFSVAYAASAPWFGALADRVGRRRVLVAGLVAFAASNVLTGLAPWFWLLLVARSVAGLAVAAVSPSVYALVGGSAPVGRRGAWMSIAVAGFLISLTTGAPSGTVLAAALGWQAVFVLLGGVAVGLAVINAMSWPELASAAAGPRSPLGLLTRVRAVSVVGLWGFAVYAPYTYLGTGLRTDSGMSSGRVALALAVYGVGAVAGSLGGGQLADRYTPGRVATTSLLLVAALLLVVDLAVPAPAPLLLVSLFMFALCAYPGLPSHQARLVASFPAHSGSLLAWNSSALYLGTSLGAAAGGALLSGHGFRAIPVAGAAAALLGAVASAYWAIDRRVTTE